jgi:hypothetical protein
VEVMGWKRKIMWVVTMALGLGIVAPVSAQPAWKKRKEERKEKREERKEDRKEKREDRKEDRKERREKMKERFKARKATVVARRKTRRAEMRKKWGPILKKPGVRAELTLHARRMARINQAIIVAKAEGKDDLVDKLRKLKTTEMQRHQTKMGTFKK